MPDCSPADAAFLMLMFISMIFPMMRHAY